MRGKIAAGIIAGLLAATVLVGVVAVSYNAGRNDNRTVQVVDDSGTTTAHVIEVSRGWHGPGPFALIIPVLLIVALVLVITRHRRWGPHGWYGYGPGGPGGPGWSPYGRPGWGPYPPTEYPPGPSPAGPAPEAPVPGAPPGTGESGS
jgi:hypothetical protein